MGKKLKITESQLKMLVENKNRKIVSEEPEQGRINAEFNLVYLVRGMYDKSILRSKRTGKYGLYSEKFKWMLQPDFVETNIDLMGEEEDKKIIIEFTNSDGKKFYVMYPVSMGTDMGTTNVEVLSQKQYAELGHEFQSIKPNEEPSTEMGNTDKVYEEGDMDEELDGPSKEEYFAKHGDDNMGWTGSSNKTYQDLPDGDYDDESYDDFDTLHAAYPDFHSHYSGKGNVDRARGMFDTYRNIRGPLRMKKIKRVDNELNESIKGYKTDFDRYLKGPKQ
jgi:hypothetical protein